MANDPAFLFYPGDYLRDTQCLSPNAQVAYDRIMCEHMRNICITQQQLNFFIKRLNEEEKNEVMFLLKKIPGGFQIEWVAESICKRRAYSESRRKNKKGKTKNISKTYDVHMENEIVIVNEDIIKNKTGFFLNEFDKNFQLSELDIEKSVEFIKLKTQKSLSRPEILNHWQAFKIDNFDKKEWYPDTAKLISHFRNSLKIHVQNNASNTNHTSKLGTSAARIEALKNW